MTARRVLRVARRLRDLRLERVRVLVEGGLDGGLALLLVILVVVTLAAVAVFAELAARKAVAVELEALRVLGGGVVGW